MAEKESHDTNGTSTTRSKRNRTQLSCTACRHAKLRCDRQVPCSQCVKKGRAATCTIPSPATRKKPVVSMQNRLRHLESLVKGVMTGETPPSLNNDSPQMPRVMPAESTNKLPENELRISETEKEEQNVTESMARLSAIDPILDASGVLNGTSQPTFVGATHW